MTPETQNKTQRELELSIRTVLSSQSGRRVLAWILGKTYQRSSITSSDPLLMANLSGRRDVGVDLANELERLSPDNFDLMVKEMRHDRSGDDNGI